MAPLLEVRDLKKHFAIHEGVFSRTVGHVRAVDGLSFHIEPGETLGLVGESGCGKSTIARTVLGLVPPTAGSIEWRGQSTEALAGRAFGALSGIRDAFIFPLSPPPIPELGVASGFTFRLQDRGGAGHEALIAARISAPN